MAGDLADDFCAGGEEVSSRVSSRRMGELEARVGDEFCGGLGWFDLDLLVMVLCISLLAFCFLYFVACLGMLCMGLDMTDRYDWMTWTLVWLDAL